MKDTTVAARYARALFMVSEKRGETARALEDLEGLREVLRPGSKVGRFLASPETRVQDKRKALRAGLEKSVVSTVIVFIDLLLRKKRLNEFETIVDEFEAIVEKAQGVRRAHLVSAVGLDRKETEKLQAGLERRTGAKIRLTSEIDPALIGGALVRIGDRVIDRSVRTLLDTISKRLHEVSV
jgi:F-type H+-transporting ATPase subunit delta